MTKKTKIQKTKKSRKTTMSKAALQPAIQPRPEPILARPAALESKKAYYVFQRKYGLDAGSPWWRKLAFEVYLRIARLFYMKPFRIPMVDGRDRQGDEFYIGHQGVYLDEAAALRAADKPLWGVHELPIDDSLPAQTTVAINHQMPASSASGRYRRNGKPTVDVPRLDLIQLAAEIERNKPLLARHKLPAA